MSPRPVRYCLVVAALAVAGDAAAFDLSSLATYQPERHVSGTIRNYGFGLGGVLKPWEDAFSTTHPGVLFDAPLPPSDAAIPALVTGVADLAPDGGEPAI